MELFLDLLADRGVSLCAFYDINVGGGQLKDACRK